MGVTKLYLNVVLINFGIDLFLDLNLGIFCKPFKKVLVGYASIFNCLFGYII